ncbi:DMT family transporter [Paenibacillus sp. 481]|uniref:DMT family transporter n=1 Tax=Paenibacillus sp. 481 TaxID=2835869 RepID=UPI001E5CDE81|nr:DMT family transporter [Paenibacillus sp. 481]UHA74676.1 DMT family transporter [Paenibacillus sp. 481]
MDNKALTQLTLAMIIFGSVGFFSSLTGLPAIELVFVRLICAAIFLFTAWMISGKFKTEVWDKKELLFIILCASANLLNWIFLFKSFEQISITIAISLYHLAPIFVLIVGSLLFKEKLTWLSMFAISLCFIGTVLIMGLGELSSSSLGWSGIVNSVLAAVFYAAVMLLGKSISKASVYATTCLQMTIGIVLLVPFVNFTAYTTLDSMQWFYAIFTGIVHTGIVYLLFFNSIRHLSTQIVSFMIFVDPAVAILLDIFLTDFRPDWLQWSGILLIFGGLFMTLKPAKSRSDMEDVVVVEKVEA